MARVRSPFLEGASVWRSDLLERKQGKLEAQGDAIEVTVPANSLATIVVERVD